MFHAGQKVVCIFGGPWTKVITDFGPPPAKDEIYVVNSVEYRSKWGCNYLRLEGFYGRLFLYSCFRPLVDTSTKQSRQAIIDDLLKTAPANREMEEVEL